MELNASFAGIYSYEIRVNDGAAAEAARTVRKARTQAEAGWLSAELGQVESEPQNQEPTAQKRRSFWQKIFPVFFLEETEEEALINDRKPEK